MKKKFEVYQYTGFENDGGPVAETIKTFKNKTDALAFYSDPKNIRRYRTLYLKMQDENGDTYEWDDRKETWERNGYQD